MASNEMKELKSTGYEVFIVLLSLLSVFNMLFVAIQTLVMGYAGPAVEVLALMDGVITPIFVFDFLYRLLTASSKKGYFIDRWGWADLLACIPMFRIFRVFRVIRVIRLLRAYGPRRFLADLVKARASATFLLTIFLVILVVEFAGATIFYAEASGPDSNIHSAGDAVWWGLVTITTVGYGDRFPTTEVGRMIGILLLFAGIGLFSVLTGFISNIFLSPQAEPEQPVLEAGDPRASIRTVRALLVEQEERAALIRRQLDELEKSFPDAAAPSA
ncbi:MAG TPA: ion transporter [Candidatus Limnocylindrales bacterium]|nr:ion transporter [Candidatus Limnocylindrales bacterium]